VLAGYALSLIQTGSPAVDILHDERSLGYVAVTVSGRWMIEPDRVGRVGNGARHVGEAAQNDGITRETLDAL